jgi:capsular exopolysaccharide synthesis family protein
MEKIKDALDKAKIQHNRRPRHGTIVREKYNDKNPKVASEVESIVYKSENVVHLDAAHLESNRIVAQDKLNPMSWVFDSLRTQILLKMEEHNWRTMAILSPTPASGKTLISINLAISIAQQQQKTVMLVDFDLRKPRIAKYLGLKREKSINEFLSGKAALSDIIVNPGIPRLTIIPTNSPVSKSAEMLSSNAIQELIIELKERYDSRIVIFDLPPILNADDAMVLLPQVDCVLLVLADGQHTEPEITETMRLLGKSNILGVVVNKSEVELRSYYY